MHAIDLPRIFRWLELVRNPVGVQLQQLRGRTGASLYEAPLVTVDGWQTAFYVSSCSNCGP
jgi:hypothetical protein